MSLSINNDFQKNESFRSDRSLDTEAVPNITMLVTNESQHQIESSKDVVLNTTLPETNESQHQIESSSSERSLRLRDSDFSHI